MVRLSPAAVSNKEDTIIALPDVFFRPLLQENRDLGKSRGGNRIDGFTHGLARWFRDLACICLQNGLERLCRYGGHAADHEDQSKKCGAHIYSFNR